MKTVAAKLIFVIQHMTKYLLYSYLIPSLSIPLWRQNVSVQKYPRAKRRVLHKRLSKNLLYLRCYKIYELNYIMQNLYCIPINCWILI